MSKNEATFGHADALDRFETGSCESESAVSGEANVFGGENDHSSRDKFRIFAGIYHSSEIIESGVGVGAAHGFNKGGNCVVMMIAFLIVAGKFFTGGFLNYGFRDFWAQGNSEL